MRTRTYVGYSLPIHGRLASSLLGNALKNVDFTFGFVCFDVNTRKTQKMRRTIHALLTSVGQHGPTHANILFSPANVYIYPLFIMCFSRWMPPWCDIFVSTISPRTFHNSHSCTRQEFTDRQMWRRIRINIYTFVFFISSFENWLQVMQTILRGSCCRSLNNTPVRTTMRAFRLEVLRGIRIRRPHRSGH